MTKANEPTWLTIARAQIGTRELPGPTHNSSLLAFLNSAKRFNGVIWQDDEMPWCGGFVAACLLAADIEPVKIAARAKSWATWGSRLQATRLSAGAVLVFDRPGGGHVGFYLGEDRAHYHVLGGNQGNAVSVSRIVKSRMTAARWPKGVPVLGKPVLLAANGTPVTRNEA
jgi:uncharacterized protein (TIGR02594 family)